jgi:hypothetical protein
MGSSSLSRFPPHSERAHLSRSCVALCQLLVRVLLQYFLNCLLYKFNAFRFALELSKYMKWVLLLEKESDLMQRASFVNRARIHDGYRYPRRILTTIRSRINFSRFVEEYRDSVFTKFDKYYAIGKLSSKTTAEQFRIFCNPIGAPIASVPKYVKEYFNSALIEDVFSVRECAFDVINLKSSTISIYNRALNTNHVRDISYKNHE